MELPELTEEIEKQVRENFSDLEVHTLSLHGYSIMAKSPPRSEIKRFVSLVEKDHYTASENLVNACALWPSKAELKELFEKRAGLPVSFAGLLTKLSGMDVGAQAKKI